MKEKGVIPLIILVIIGFLFLIAASALLKFAVPALLVLTGFAVIMIGNNTTNDQTRKLFVFIGLGITLFALLASFTGFLSIIGTPFLTQNFSTDWSPSCAFANCFNPVTQKMEGSYGIAGQFSSPTFAETSLGQDYKVRAVSCELGSNSDLVKSYIESGKTEANENKLYGLVAQIQTKDGKWLDFYYNQQSLTTVYQVPNTNEYIFHYISGTQQIDLPNEIISNKVRCRITGDWKMARYSGSLKINSGTLKVFGDAITPTCSDGIKNQDEIEIDYGGVCGTTEIIEPTTTPVTPETQLNPDEHIETINGQEIIVASSTPNNIELYVLIAGVIVLVIGFYLLRE